MQPKYDDGKELDSQEILDTLNKNIEDEEK